MMERVTEEFIRLADGRSIYTEDATINGKPIRAGQLPESVDSAVRAACATANWFSEQETILAYLAEHSEIATIRAWGDYIRDRMPDTDGWPMDFRAEVADAWQAVADAVARVLEMED